MESRFSRLTGSLISGSGLLPSKETGKAIAPVAGAGINEGDAREPDELGSPATRDRRRWVQRWLRDLPPQTEPARPAPLAMDRDVLKRSVVIWVRKRRGDEPG